jgi:heme o synthase
VPAHKYVKILTSLLGSRLPLPFAESRSVVTRGFEIRGLPRAERPMNTSAIRVGVVRESLHGLVPWLQLAKPGVTRLVVLTTLFGWIVAPGSGDLVRCLLTVLGTTLVVVAANALNMVLEVDADALMTRTRLRPLPTGRIEPAHAQRAAYVAALLGVGMLALIDHTTALLALLALASYVWVYTPLKRITPYALYVGAVPGAIPPVMGYASASGGQLDLTALVLFGILFVWQVPHFIAIALFRSEEYARAGFKVFGAPGTEKSARRLLLAWSLVLFFGSLLPAVWGVAGTLYLALALGFGAMFVAGSAYGLSAAADRAWARSLFFASMPYLIVLLVGLAI